MSPPQKRTISAVSARPNYKLWLAVAGLGAGQLGVVDWVQRIVEDRVSIEGRLIRLETDFWYMQRRLGGFDTPGGSEGPSVGRELLPRPVQRERP